MHRQYDIEVLQTITSPAPGEAYPLSLTAATTTHRAVTGIQKMAQRYVLALTTAIGSVRFDETFGTAFWSNIQRGSAQNAGMMRAAFAFASLDAQRLLAADNLRDGYGDIPADERLVSAELTDFNMDSASGTLYLKVDLTSAAGTAYTYELPVELMGDRHV